MFKSFVAGGLGLITVSGCVPTTSGSGGTVVTIAPASSASGYADTSSSIFDPSDLRDLTAIAYVPGAASDSFTRELVDVSFGATANSTSANREYSLTIGGQTYILTNSGDGDLTGAIGSTDVDLYPVYSSNSDQLDLWKINVISTDDQTAVFSGFLVDGFTSDPADVAARSGTATMYGQGIIGLLSDQLQDYYERTGLATFTVDFADQEISGTLDIRPGTLSSDVSLSTITFANLAIENNTFSGSGQMVASDFAMSSVEDLDVSGAFYEAGATGIGAQFSADGVFVEDDAPVNIIGAFAASEVTDDP